MADCMLRSAGKVCDSDDVCKTDLVKSDPSDELDLSVLDFVSNPTQAVDFKNNSAENSQYEIVNGQDNTSGRFHADVASEHAVEKRQGGLQTEADNNNESSRTFRKSFSAVALSMLPAVDDSRSTYSLEVDVVESSDSTDLRQQLKKLQEDLKRKEEECQNLTHVQLQTGQELEELTASLFEEANKMVQDANIKRMAMEKCLIEANSKIEVLQAEVTALKALVLTSTPSKPNPHLNPQIDKTKKAEFRGHRRSTSHHSFIKEIHLPRFNFKDELPVAEKPKPPEESEPEPLKSFRLWRQSPSLDVSSSFLLPIISEDILPCLNFANTELSKKVYDGIFNNTVSVEPLFSQKINELQHCALSELDMMCAYSFKLGDLQTPFPISKMARNRIIAVCDFVTYVRYIMQGLVKSSDKEVYAEILQLRKRMCLARLGLEE